MTKNNKKLFWDLLETFEDQAFELSSLYQEWERDPSNFVYKQIIDTENKKEETKRQIYKLLPI